MNLRFWLALLLALCLLSMQALGQWHRMVHSKPALATLALGQGGSASLASPDGSFWGHQAGDAACHLLDQLGQHQLPTAGCALGLLQMAQGDAPGLQPSSAAAQLFWKRGARAPPSRLMA
ncbi:hypothetical protein HNP55_000008 [Paucibacter oligotrophus]|uniref:Uncharacterized protein n=1 Tax=Roseateles oligotrophus TaxID=1769250 RepID=A0A840L3S4_9BURK|nr:hypothetical protein [Roseateles oligotrophus]MBB4841513.1 hypothetical protein [Roseateles oligotrophus]